MITMRKLATGIFLLSLCLTCTHAAVLRSSAVGDSPVSNDNTTSYAYSEPNVTTSPSSVNGRSSSQVTSATVALSSYVTGPSNTPDISPEESDDNWKVAVGLVIPLLAIIAVGIVVYICYRKKYPVRMIIGREFGKFSNPDYNRSRIQVPTLVRDDAEDYFTHMRDSTTGQLTTEYNPVGVQLEYENPGFQKDIDDDEDEKERMFIERKSWLFKKAASSDEEEDSVTYEVPVPMSAENDHVELKRKESKGSDTDLSDILGEQRLTPKPLPRRKGKGKQSTRVESMSSKDSKTSEFSDASSINVEESIDQTEISRNASTTSLSSKTDDTVTSLDNENRSKYSQMVKILFEQPSFEQVVADIRARSRSMTSEHLPLPQNRPRFLSVDPSKSARRSSLINDTLMQGREDTPQHPPLHQNRPRFISVDPSKSARRSSLINDTLMQGREGTPLSFQTKGETSEESTPTQFPGESISISASVVEVDYRDKTESFVSSLHSGSSDSDDERSMDNTPSTEQKDEPVPELPIPDDVIGVVTGDVTADVTSDVSGDSTGDFTDDVAVGVRVSFDLPSDMIDELKLRDIDELEFRDRAISTASVNSNTHLVTDLDEDTASEMAQDEKDSIAQDKENELTLSTENITPSNLEAKLRIKEEDSPLTTESNTQAKENSLAEADPLPTTVAQSNPETELRTKEKDSPLTTESNVQAKETSLAEAEPVPTTVAQSNPEIELRTNEKNTPPATESKTQAKENFPAEAEPAPTTVAQSNPEIELRTKEKNIPPTTESKTQAKENTPAEVEPTRSTRREPGRLSRLFNRFRSPSSSRTRDRTSTEESNRRESVSSKRSGSVSSTEQLEIISVHEPKDSPLSVRYDSENNEPDNQPDQTLTEQSLPQKDIDREDSPKPFEHHDVKETEVDEELESTPPQVPMFTSDQSGSTAVFIQLKDEQYEPQNTRNSIEVLQLSASSTDDKEDQQLTSASEKSSVTEEVSDKDEPDDQPVSGEFQVTAITHEENVSESESKNDEEDESEHDSSVVDVKEKIKVTPIVSFHDIEPSDYSDSEQSHATTSDEESDEGTASYSFGNDLAAQAETSESSHHEVLMDPTSGVSDEPQLSFELGTHGDNDAQQTIISSPRLLNEIQLSESSSNSSPTADGKVEVLAKDTLNLATGVIGNLGDESDSDISDYEISDGELSGILGEASSEDEVNRRNSLTLQSAPVATSAIYKFGNISSEDEDVDV